MQPAICLLSVVPVRLEPSHRSEMVSQLLFGEFVDMGEEREDFVAVKCLYDGYEGWVQANQLTPVAEKQSDATHYTATFSSKVEIDGRCRRVPFATPVFSDGLSGEPMYFGDRVVRYKIPDNALWKVAAPLFSDDRLEKAVSVYADAPYLWGGKSVWGTDCSGFVQQVGKLFGVMLLRDAYLQAAQGKAVNKLDEASVGDLLFFQNEKGRIVHVGILLQNREIIHASGRVRRDVVNETGIIDRATGKQTHFLHSIRRFF